MNVQSHLMFCCAGVRSVIYMLFLNKKNKAAIWSMSCIVCTWPALILSSLDLQPVRSVNSRRKHIQTASLRHVMGFPHRGLLRKLRQPARHRSHAPLTSVADLPRFTCLDSDILRRLPVALFILACRKLAEVSNASVIDAAAPVFHLHVRTPSSANAYLSLPVPSARHAAGHCRSGSPPSHPVGLLGFSS